MAKKSVSFTTNVCVADEGFAEQTIRHMVRALGYPFAEKHIVLDTGALSGKYLNRPLGKIEDLKHKMVRLVEDDVVDSVYEVPWDQHAEAHIRNRYLLDKDSSLRDRDGAPIFQYLYALDQCVGDYILHADSDMLFYSGSRKIHWIDEAIDLMESRPDVIAANQVNGPPKAVNLIERVLKKKLPPSVKRSWYKPRILGTRCFLIHAARMREQLLPLIENSPGEPLEDMLSHTAEQRGLIWLSLRSDDRRDAWWIHPMRQDDTFEKHVDKIIRTVEKGAYPVKRWGERYNIYTYGVDWQYWWKIVQRF